MTVGTASTLTSHRRDALTTPKIIALNDAGATAGYTYVGAETPALALEDVSLSFGGVKALTDVTLLVKPSEIRAIIGPNGAGKSSLINVISGIYKPNKGIIRIAGNSFPCVPTERLAHLGVSRTFQNIALFKGLSVFDNIAVGRVSSVKSNTLQQIFGSKQARREREETEAKVEEALEHMHLSAVRDRLAASLSYGMQKRVELARALVIEPKLLLLDEPMAGMTGTEKQEMSQFVREARSRCGTTIVLIEHDIGVVMGMSDRVTVLDYGRKIADGTPSQVMNDPAVIDAYLGVPHDSNQ
jgi:branched-chain amino acid transport system ATP-binding protein